MHLGQLSGEFRELNKIIEDMKGIDEIFTYGEISMENLLAWSSSIRWLSKTEGVLENKSFESKLVRKFVKDYLDCVENIFEGYDQLIVMVQMDKTDSVKEKIKSKLEMVNREYGRLYGIKAKISMAEELISEITKEIWEPLPENEKEDNVDNIIISSETRSMSLNNVASDVGNLDSFFKNISLLIEKDQYQSNNVYLRRIETGSLLVAVSCAMQAAPIIAFIFWCVKLYQKAEKRYLDNADKKLEIINKSMNIAKEILEVDPDNKEAEEAIQRCGVHLLNFLENNPTGTINGEHYDIGIEKLKIEDKEENM